MARIDIQQGSAEWLALRRTKITASDAGVITQLNPWKTPRDLFFEKYGFIEIIENEAMRRVQEWNLLHVSISLNRLEFL